MGEAVLDRLADHRRDAGHVSDDRVDVAPHAFLVVAGKDRDLDLGAAHRLGVLVPLGAPGAARHAADALDLREPRLDAAREPVALLERGSGRSHQEDRERALVELGQEARAERRAEPDREDA